METLFRKLESPALVNLQLHWPDETPVELAAALPSDVYAGDPLVVTARLSKSPKGVLTLTGNSGGRAWTRQLVLRPVSNQGGISKLWARERIGELSRQRNFGDAPQEKEAKIVELALAHHLVSDFTSLVAVDVTPVRPAELPLDKAQAPTSAPQGSYWAKSTGFPRTATPAPLLMLIGLLLIFLAFAMWLEPRRAISRLARPSRVGHEC
jgi:Ca-activated chloride channel family protein